MRHRRRVRKDGTVDVDGHAWQLDQYQSKRSAEAVTHAWPSRPRTQRPR